jgi:hypothetical protein
MEASDQITNAVGLFQEEDACAAHKNRDAMVSTETPEQHI